MIRALALTAFLAFALASTAAAAEQDGRTWYVRADAAGGGNGSRGAPFDSLAAVERASRRGDRIIVLPAPRSAGALDGGIRLKPRQRLVGAGPQVGTARARQRAPRLTNTDGSHLEGDAVRLARRTVVRNLEISGARRGGIYGRNVPRVRIVGNDILGHNTSCTRGFHIPPFNVPTTVPGVGIPISEGLHNGWAGIMVDATRRGGQVTIVRNRVHDAECGDGIDVRVSGAAWARARIARNDVRELRQGEDFESILAIGLQTRDRGRLAARLNRNRQAALGNDEDIGVGPTGADSEGVFINPAGPSRMRVAVSRNRYTHTPGRGGFSANGLEFVSMGDGPRALVKVRNSRFSGTPGDVIEQLALGTNARLRMRLDEVVATRSTGFAGSGIGDTVLIPGNNGDCVIAASGGAGNVVDLRVRRSELTNCANNGLTFGSAVANGSGATAELLLDVSETRITGNRGGNLRIGNLTALERLAVKVERTNLSDSQGISSTPANLTVENLGATRRSAIDLGGGPLGSRGDVCLGGGLLAALLVRYDVHAQNAWWGRPGGPGLGRVVAIGGALDASRPRGTPPAGC
jgi:hypothetical protein